MTVPTPGNVDITIITDILLEPSMFFLIFIICGICGLITGKIQSDRAKAKTPDSDPLMANESLFDWSIDYGCGVVGGIIGLAIILSTGLPILLLPGFGFAGRVLLIKIGKKAESTI